ncbi:MAG: hypothetical protein AUH83_02090 [Deltaproteobacteria bacterium 13_1_40CM_4_68_19]|nr:MAG: hypothetical protein AUH83_02090 [Deltaproteobacteria bacterium 13_1_40CM_4_68_19]OLD09959.1 MAG: hypothetical protein AUI90_02370 [Deltaproteobacteria bacterium 13_1_40CM_3_69_14]OLD46401.1 MAG: hypothetical protein AUI48_08530 [Chloroflexi bacterium 13_1_40CM_2_68_14]
MHWTEEDHPLWTWLLRACAAAIVVPLWSAGHLPFTDLPQHVSAIATLRHWWDPAWKSQQYFTLELGQTQYLLYYLAGAALAFPFGSAERANLVLLSAIAISYPYSLRSLLRALGVDTRLALFGCALFWSQALLIGFFNYVAAMPLTIWALALALRQAGTPSRRTLLTLAAAAVALFYLHLSAFIFLAPAAALVSIGVPRLAPLREWPRKLLWLAPVAVLSVLWLLNSPVVHPESVGWRQPMAVTWEPPATSLRNLTDALLDIWRGPEDEWCLLALLAAIALIAWPQRREPEEHPWRRGVVAVWLAWAAVLYLAFPVSIGWMWQLNERYALLFALLVPALLRPARGLRGALPLLLVAATAFFAAGTALANIRAFEREVGPFDDVLARAQPGRRLIGMIFEQNSRYAKFSAFLHFQAYYRARMGGVASFSFAELPQSPLRYRPENAPPPHPAGWEWHANAFRNDLDGYYYDYVLVGGLVDPFGHPQPGPHWRLLVREGRWALYEKQD